jgi:hypothetical protein
MLVRRHSFRIEIEQQTLRVEQKIGLQPLKSAQSHDTSASGEVPTTKQPGKDLGLPEASLPSGEPL